jgi:hypothetical protein
MQKIRETIKLESIHEWHFVERENEGRMPDKNSSLRRLEFMPRNIDQKCRSRIPSLEEHWGGGGRTFTVPGVRFD